MLIPFTQYLRPDGRQKDVSIDINYAAGNKAKELIDAGAKFEAEVLRTGVVSFECINYNVDEDDLMFCLSNRLVPNGPRVKEVVMELVNEAYESMFGSERSLSPDGSLSPSGESMEESENER